MRKKTKIVNKLKNKLKDKNWLANQSLAPKVKPYDPKYESVKVGFEVYDKRGKKFVVSKIEYAKTGPYSIKEPATITLKSEKVRGERVSIQKVSIKDFGSRYRTFNPRHLLDLVPTVGSPSPIATTFYSANPVVAEKPSYLNNLFKDDRPTRMTGIISAIQEQMKKDEFAAGKRESDVSMTYNAIQTKFNGFIAKSGWFAEKVSSVIIFIDWLGEECRFKDYKESTFEKNKDYNVVIVYTRNKVKSFFINLLKWPILKYSTNGGK